LGRRLIEAGRPGSLAPRSDRWQEYLRRLEPTSDGELWAVEDDGVVVRLEGQALVDGSAGRRSASGSPSSLPDGSLWRVVRGTDGAPMLAASSGDGAWELQDATGLESLLVPGAARYTFGRTADGRTWFGVDHGARGGGLAVHAGDGWTLLGEQDPERALRVRAMEPDPDGSLWVLGSVGAPGPSTRHVLVRITDDRMEILDDAAGMPRSRMQAWTGWSPLQVGALAIDRRGKIWFSIDDVGLWTYDSTGFRRITRPELRAGALDLETAPDGSIWAVSRHGALYRLADPVAPQAPSVEPVQYDALASTQWRAP
jgi:ligand-binding sensor domain-containing protein